MSGPYAQTWETYQDLGWQGVLPLPERKKANPPRGFTGAGGAWPTYADCWSWADDPHLEDGNIALRLPDGIIGIDVDAYDGKPGANTLAAGEQQWGALPATWRTTSRDDGISGIRLYQAPTGLAWPGEVGAGIEIIQERHRYAVAPPSIHPEGRTYRWITPEGAVSTVPPTPDTLPHLPQAWVDGLTSGAAYSAAPRADLDDHAVIGWLASQPRAAEVPCERMSHLLDAALFTLTDGSAHNNANLAAMRLIRLSDEGHAGVAEALDHLRRAFLAEATRSGRAGQARTEGEASAEWARNIRGAVQLVAGRPSASDTCDCGSGLADLIAPSASPSASESAPSASPAETPLADQLTPTQIANADEARRLAHERLVAEEITKLEVREEAKRRLRAKQRPTETPTISLLDDFLSIEDPPQRYRLDGLWPLGGRVMLAAQFKAGKTTLVGNLVRSLVDGSPFLDQFPVEPLAADRRVVIIDDELDQRMIRAWLRDQGIANTRSAAVLPLRGNLASFDILDPQVRSQWANALRQAGAEVVVLDCLAPLLDALGLSEDKEAGQLLVAFDELLGEAGVGEAVVVHHMGHSGERTRGASRLRDWPDVEWRLVREKSENGENDPAAPRYFSAYGRDVEISEAALQFEPTTRRLSLVGGSRAGAALRGAREAIVELLTVRSGLSGRAIIDELADEFTQKDVRAALKQAVNEGQILTAPGPRRATLHRVAECVTTPSNKIGPNSVSAGETQCVSALPVSGLKTDGMNPVRQGPNALNTQVTGSVSQCVTSESTQSGASESVSPPIGGTHTDALKGSDSQPGPTKTPLGEKNLASQIVVIDGRIITVDDGSILTPHDGFLLDASGAIRGHVTDLPRGAA